MMKKMMRLTALLTAVVLSAAAVGGCGGGSSVGTVYTDKEYGFQLEKPAAGDKVAVLHTSMGDISIRLFPEAAPKAVENFTDLAKQGYYDGLTFHRVMKDFMIQGGDPKGDGTGGESKWGEAFVDEFDQKLMNLRGSLSMANSGPDTNGSQFFINQAGPDGRTAAELKELYEQRHDQFPATKKAFKEQYASQYSNWEELFNQYYYDAPVPKLVPDEVWELYAEHGGNIHLDGAWRQDDKGHTVFGQVYDGMDVVDAIAAVKTDEESGKPVENVLINSIEILEYTA